MSAMTLTVITVTINHQQEGETAYDIAFGERFDGGVGFAPFFDGQPLVKAPASEGRELTGGILPYYTQANERTAGKVAKALYAGRMVQADLFTKGGNLRKGWEDKAQAAHVAAGETRTARVAVLKGQGDARKEAAKLAKAERDANKPPTAPKAKKAGKGKGKGAGKVASVTPQMAALNDIERIRGLVADGVPANVIALAYTVDETYISALAPLAATGK